MRSPGPRATFARLARRARLGLRVPALDRCRADTVVTFDCNLCGARNAVAFAQLARETPSCAACASTVRFRSIGHLVARELFGADLALPDLPRRPEVRGLGLSDADAYAKPLADRLGYENTFFHQSPQLDITAIDEARAGRYDFVVASDVFEHVLAPVSRAFVNARRLLKPGGAFILTVPFGTEGPTREHFPELHDWRIEGEGDARVLVNRTADGREQRYADLCFHGGDGSTLEMRLFSRDDLLRELREAGFAHARIAGEACLPFGIVWPEPWSVPIVARAPA
ncbi:MAG: methyltransferase domain-containing protein [Betaproteobacteria bacterium]|nr:methyltransferase domain-containing protein [Betaproteobacteria bacterium]